jgi:hypothetical protein
VGGGPAGFELLLFEAVTGCSKRKTELDGGASAEAVALSTFGASGSLVSGACATGSELRSLFASTLSALFWSIFSSIT